MSKNFVSIMMFQIMEPEKPIREKIEREAVLELAESMRKLGQLQPILVRREGDKYRIEAGHRRYLAASSLSWAAIDAIILDPTDEDTLHLERAHENLIRADLNVVEEAQIVWDLVYEDGRGVERTAKLLCKAETWINSRLDIAKMPEDLKDALRTKTINISVARELEHVKDASARLRLTRSAAEYGASAAVVRNWCRDSQIGEFLSQKETSDVIQDAQPLLLAEASMGCRVCNIPHKLSTMRHIWLCPNCMGAMRDLAFETQKILKEMEAAGTK